MIVGLIISFPTSIGEIIVLLKTSQNIDKSSQLYFVRANGMLHCTKTLLVQLVFMHAHGIMTHNS